MLVGGTAQRVLQGSAAMLSWSPLDQDGEPSSVDPGTVTVNVTNALGTVLASSLATAATGAMRTVTLSATETGVLDLLALVWVSGGLTVATTYCEVVGGVYFTSADLRLGQPALSDPGRDMTSTLLNVRASVEAAFESACGVAFVPRFAVERVRVTSRRVVTAWAQLRDVRWVRYWQQTPDVTTDLSAPGLNKLDFGTEGVIDLGSVVGAYAVNQTWLLVGYEHGYDAPFPDVKRAAMTYARSLAFAPKSGMPDRATSMQMPDGGVATLATPGVGRWHSGIPSVDEVLRRYDLNVPMAST